MKHRSASRKSGSFPEYSALFAGIAVTGVLSAAVCMAGLSIPPRSLALKESGEMIVEARDPLVAGFTARAPYISELQNKTFPVMFTCGQYTEFGTGDFLKIGYELEYDEDDPGSYTIYASYIQLWTLPVHQ